MKCVGTLLWRFVLHFCDTEQLGDTVILSLLPEGDIPFFCSLADWWQVFSLLDRSSSWTAQLQQQVGCRESCQQPLHGGHHASVRGGAAHSLHPGAQARPQCCGWVFLCWQHSKQTLLVILEWLVQLLSPVTGGPCCVKRWSQGWGGGFGQNPVAL